jgi:hypothetical protein
MTLFMWVLAEWPNDLTTASRRASAVGGASRG